MTDLTNRPLAGKTAVVTGAGRGIGRACALCLAGAGANLVLLEKDDAPLREATEAIEKLASRPLPLQLDCTSETEVEHIPMRRLARPEEIGRVVLFLAGPDSDYITGQSIVVDGGQWML